jgi:hypothetical protein
LLIATSFRGQAEYNLNNEMGIDISRKLTWDFMWFRLVNHSFEVFKQVSSIWNIWVFLQMLYFLARRFLKVCTFIRFDKTYRIALRD